MPTIKKHKPGCISESENDNKPIEFNSIEELLNIEFVRQQTYSNQVSLGSFHKYSKSTPNEKETLLMAEFNDGKDWCVLGYIEGGNEMIKSLPNWVPKR